MVVRTLQQWVEKDRPGMCVVEWFCHTVREHRCKQPEGWGIRLPWVPEAMMCQVSIPEGRLVGPNFKDFLLDLPFTIFCEEHMREIRQ